MRLRLLRTFGMGRLICTVYLADLAVQPRRFDLFYGFGCRAAIYPSIATIFLVMVPPLLLTAATIVYAGA